MVLTRAFACATPVVASDITGYRDVMTAETSVAVPPGEPEALADAIAALLEDEPRREALGAAARQLAIDRYSWADIARRLDGIYDAARGVESAGGRVRGVPRSPWLRASLVVPCLVAVVVLLWWRGPDWNIVYRAFDLVNWAWIVFAVGLNLGSVLLRSLAWRLTIDQALDPPHPRFNWVFSGVLRSVCSPTRSCPAGSGSSRVSRCCAAGCRTAAARRGLLVGTVFAHRLFDLFPALLLVAYVIKTARIPHWAATSLVIVSVLGSLLFTAAVHQRPAAAPRPTARRRHAAAAAARDGPAGPRRCSARRCPRPARSCSSAPAGSSSSSPSTSRCARSTSTRRCRPPALVLLLMNVATIFPLWPGNIGLLQAAVALPLVQYGVAYSTGFAFALVLQVVEMSVGVGVGLLFLAREGLSFATLRGMPDASRARRVEEETGPPAEAARARAGVSG